MRCKYVPFAVALAIAGPVAAQMPNPAALIAAQQKAIAAFAKFDGAWRGEAVTQTPAGEQRITQTERFGPFLDGTLRMVEGRGFGADGVQRFHAFGVISWNAEAKAYEFRSHAQGHAGTFAITPTAEGYVWEIPAGPATIRYTATIKDGVWNEVGDRVVAGKPQRFFEMNLKRIGDIDWEAGAVGSK